MSLKSPNNFTMPIIYNKFGNLKLNVAGFVSNIKIGIPTINS